MNKKFKIAIVGIVILAAFVALFVWLSGQPMPVLQPKGMIGVKQRDLMVISTLLMFIVVIPVFILTLAFAWKYRESNKSAKYTPDWGHSYVAEFLWWGIPLVIIVALSIITWKSTHELNPFNPIDTGKKALNVQVVALNWKWLFIYPEHGIASVNLLEFPEKTPVSFEITSDAPMNSFWIPQLGGQIYAMPAMRSKLHLIADEKGTFRGCSANLSGKGFSGMNFEVIAGSEKDFYDWIGSIKASAPLLNSESYEKLKEPSSYDKPIFYRLDQGDLFDQIIMKYSMP